MAVAEVQLSASAWAAIDDSGNYPEPVVVDYGTPSVRVWAFDDTVEEFLNASFWVPTDLGSGSVTFAIATQVATAAGSGNQMQWRFSHAPRAHNETMNFVYTNEDSGDLAMIAASVNHQIHTWTETLTNLTWNAGEKVYCRLSRIATTGTKYTGDIRLLGFNIRIPV